MMKQAYGELYELENTLRIYIKETMMQHYGIDWWIRAPIVSNYPAHKRQFNELYYHELISLLSAYDCLSNQFSTKLSPIAVHYTY